MFGEADFKVQCLTLSLKRLGELYNAKQSFNGLALIALVPKACSQHECVLMI